ncbi:nitronate monooxygenase [Pseudarthrobacter sp. GA104]|uniref:nitronate monooxygenase n=1 Tax=Pseudarthrobacter sp. GA104 TaxID=2676311 RepID=UPI0012FA4BDE|nr:nitronate monooxygenase [Pseudarthrobacter sp. GA104]MUU70589.1 hypothetical protein [Pseudarthrobacter sp. GA104]
MLRTTFYEVLGVEHPVVQAGMGPFGSGAELAAAVSNSGALGSLGGAGRSPEDLRHQLSVLRTLTERPFAVNSTQPWLQQHPESFDIALEMHAPVVSRMRAPSLSTIRRTQYEGSSQTPAIRNFGGGCPERCEGGHVG